ncbi:putative dehydrogenase [Pyrobaculum oguniense TE7]|uniref:Dehydrogenase n=1 Tax=Pyrobaculum oguniense (strain DSM 13380 / JCM 10595 / TE7) TaxID=698757 RepID=H6QB38_PYROT|nr:putative dehydrogenase [Pyrobaculum oguniense TE7]
MDFDVVVVGSGVVGLFVTHELVRRGFSVAVVDRYLEPGWGVSKRHAGVIHVIQLPFSAYKSRLMRRGNKMYPAICKWLGVECREVPALLVVDKWWKIPLVFVACLYLRLNGVDCSVCLRCAEYRRDFNFATAVVVRGYKVVDSFGLIYRLYDVLRATGVHFYLGCEVRSFAEDGDGVVVETSCGALRGRYLVNAAGLYADELAKKAGIDVEIKPGKGVMAIFHGREIGAIIAPLTLQPHPRTKGGAVIPTIYGTVLFGPNLVDATSKGDFETDPENFNLLVEKFSRYVKDFDKLTPVKIFAGNRPLSPTGDVMIKTGRRSVHIIGTESPIFTGAPALAQDVVKILEEMGMEKREPTELPPPEPIKKCGRVVCPCRGVTECEIREAVRRGSRTLDGVMYRFGIGMGLCQGSRCLAEILKIISEELGVEPGKVTKFGGGSWLVLS